MLQRIAPPVPLFPGRSLRVEPVLASPRADERPSQRHSAANTPRPCILTLGYMFRVMPWGWWNESRDERELTRLELVALAAEVAAVAEHAKGMLLPEGCSRRADRQHQRCRHLLRSAHQVLSTDARLDNLSTPDLQKAVESFRALQRKLGTLRGESDFSTETMLG